MRNRLQLILAVFAAACVGAPAYQAPSVRVAPAYSAVARESARPTDSSATPSRSTAVTVNPQPGTEAVAPSAQYSTAVSAAPFWRDLGDPTLTRLIEEALKTSTDVDAAEARVTSARASRRVSSFDLAPTITAIGSASRQRSSIAQLPGLTSQLPQRNLYDVGFDASWELDVFGRVNTARSPRRPSMAFAMYW
jgi:outer membrane protein TolC